MDSYPVPNASKKSGKRPDSNASWIPHRFQQAPKALIYFIFFSPFFLDSLIFIVITPAMLLLNQASDRYKKQDGDSSGPRCYVFSSIKKWNSQKKKKKKKKKMKVNHLLGKTEIHNQIDELGSPSIPERPPLNSSPRSARWQFYYFSTWKVRKYTWTETGKHKPNFLKSFGLKLNLYGKMWRSPQWCMNICISQWFK